MKHVRLGLIVLGTMLLVEQALSQEMKQPPTKKGNRYTWFLSGSILCR
jgi:hypothetical protein